MKKKKTVIFILWHVIWVFVVLLLTILIYPPYEAKSSFVSTANATYNGKKSIFILQQYSLPAYADSVTVTSKKIEKEGYYELYEPLLFFLYNSAFVPLLVWAIVLSVRYRKQKKLPKPINDTN